MAKAPKWRGLLERFISKLRIVSREKTAALGETGIELILWRSQRMILDAITAGMDAGIRMFLVLKSRQLGSSTIFVIIDIFWLALHPGMKGALVVDQEKTRDSFREQIRNIIASIPAGYFGGAFGIKKGGDNKYMMVFTNGSQLDFLVAGTSGAKVAWGESSGYSLVHLCVARGTPVVTANGMVKAIEDVQVGDRVLTHSGADATVIDVAGYPNDRGDMMRISPWLGHPLVCSPDHTIPTHRGTIEARKVTKDDWLVMPLRRISAIVAGDVLPETPAARRTRATDAFGRFARNDGSEGVTVAACEPWVTVVSAGSGHTIRFTEETGFAMGYYLAEGTVIKQAVSGRPSGITFTRHRSEGSYADRAITALSHLTTGSRRTYEAKNCLTTQESIYGSSLASWVDSNFGHGAGKIIPDDVFSWGEDFCRGLLAGLLSGDGSKGITYAGKYALNTMILPSTRSSLAMQARDIAAALGYGWGAMRYESPGTKHGRICKAQWRVMWAGEAAGKLRALVGLPVVPGGRSRSQKYKIENGLVFLKIKEIKTGFPQDERWDISVDHKDHTFRTPYMSIGNTEIASYGSEEGLNNFEEAMSEKNPDRLYIYESTAKGYNHWRKRWIAARKDAFTRACIFVGWWGKDDNSIPRSDPRFAVYGLTPPDERERTKIAAVKERYGWDIQPEQLAWIRWRAHDDKQTESSLNQNQPWTEEDAFVMSGKSYFQTRLLVQDYERISSVPYEGYRFWMGSDFWATQLERLSGETRRHEIELRVWQWPVPDAQYVIGMDPAGGSDDKNDRHACQVFRCYADRLVQVAEYADNICETRQAAWVLAFLGGVYRNSLLNIELSGGYGTAVMVELDHLKEMLHSDLYAHKRTPKGTDWTDFLDNARYYIYRRPDNPATAGYIYNWISSQDRKSQIFNEFRDCHVNGTLEINSKLLLEEMQSIVQEGISIGAPNHQKDDRCVAACLATHTYIQHVRSMLMMQGETYERVSARESGERRGAGHMVDAIVSQYLKQVETTGADDQGPAQTWLQERGLA